MGAVGELDELDECGEVPAAAPVVVDAVGGDEGRTPVADDEETADLFFALELVTETLGLPFTGTVGLVSAAAALALFLLGCPFSGMSPRARSHRTASWAA